MHFASSLFTAAFLSTVLALPIIDENVDDAKSLVARLGRNDGGDPNNAIDVRMDATGWNIVADQDAWAMLCGQPPAPRIYQRLEEKDPKERKKHKSKHYRNSGAAARPNKGNNPKKYNLRQPHLAPGAEPWDSTEEIPFESSNVVGESSTTAQRRVITFPAPMSEQRQQGSHMTTSLDRAGVGFGSWYHIVAFDNCNLDYCIAFNNNDYSVCRKKLKNKQNDPDELAAIRISNPGQNMAFANIGYKGWSKRDVAPEDELDNEGEDIDLAERDTLDLQSEDFDELDNDELEEDDSSIEKRDIDDLTPEMELVLDDLPAIDRD